MATMAKKTNKTGALQKSLKRNSDTIRKDRADNVLEDSEIAYRRKVENLKIKLNKLGREQSAMLDLSPDDTNSLIMAKDFDADKFVETDLDLQVKIRNTELKLEVAEARYSYLFGGE